MIKKIFLIIFLILIFLNLSYSFEKNKSANHSDPELLVRSNIKDGFNISALTFLNKSRPYINNRGDVVFKIANDDSQSIWYKAYDEKQGDVIFETDPHKFIAGPSLNEEGNLLFSIHEEGLTDGLFKYDNLSKEVYQLFNPNDKPIQHYTYPQLKNEGKIYFRGTDDFDVRSFYFLNSKNQNEITSPTFEKLLSEEYNNGDTLFSFLFKPSVNEEGAFAFQARFGARDEFEESNPDHLLILKPDHTIELVAKDRDSDPNSKFISFSHNVSLNNFNEIAFMSIIEIELNQLKTLKKAIFIKSNSIVSKILVEGEYELESLDSNSFKLNNKKQLLFKAKNKSGKWGIYLIDLKREDKSPLKVIEEGDELKTDLGVGYVLSNPNYPAFITEIDFNDNAEIVFNCFIVDKNLKELGLGIFKVSPLQTKK